MVVERGRSKNFIFVRLAGLTQHWSRRTVWVAYQATPKRP